MLRARPVLLGLAAGFTAAGLYALVARPRMRTWGATPDEVAAAYPGDELVPEPTGGATMATTLPAPPESVWPWLVQMGCGRGGWYSWDGLDNGGVPSAHDIVPEWQNLAEGQHLDRVGSPFDRHPSQANWWTVVVLKPNQVLVLQTSYGLFGGALDPPTGRVPPGYVEGVWSFHLRPATGGRTRLVVRTRSRSQPSMLTRPLDLLVGQPLHFIMQTRQFHNLETRVAIGAGSGCASRDAPVGA